MLQMGTVGAKTFLYCWRLRLGHDKAETGNRACEGVTGLASASALFNYARLNFSFGCLQRGQSQSAGRSSNATPSCSAGSYT